MSELDQKRAIEQALRAFAAQPLKTAATGYSSFARDFLRAYRRSNIHLYPDDWKKLPIPDVLPEQQAPIVKIVDKNLTAKRSNPDVDVSAHEAEIDNLVSRLYGQAPERAGAAERREAKQSHAR